MAAKWSSIRISNELLDALAEAPDAKHLSKNGLVSRAVDLYLQTQNNPITPVQIANAFYSLSEEERVNLFLLMARHIASDLINQSQTGRFDEWAITFICQQAQIERKRLQDLMSGANPNQEEILAITRVMATDFGEVKRILGLANSETRAIK